MHRSIKLSTREFGLNLMVLLVHSFLVPKATVGQSTKIEISTAYGLTEQTELEKVGYPRRVSKRDDPIAFCTDRLLFNGFLIDPAKPIRIRAKIRNEELDIIKSTAKSRQEKVTQSLAQLRAEWPSLSIDERNSALSKFVKEDEEDVSKLCDTLEEILTPSKRSALLIAFMSSIGTHACSDPIARRWLGMSKAQAEQVRNRFDEGSGYLIQQWQKMGVPLATPLPKPQDDVYGKTRALMWEGFEANTLKIVLVHAGMMTEDEELYEYLDRIDERDGEALVNYVPIFAQSLKSKPQDKK